MKQTDTFDPSYFEWLKEAEAGHFWFQIRRKWIFDKIKKFIQPPAKVLEIGCGTGNISHFLGQKGYRVIGYEFYTEAMHRAWPGFLKVQGDANYLPFTDNSFDVVGLFDLIEHFQDDMNPLKEAIRVVREGGIIVITVPARKELWSRFDEISFHKQRYTTQKLKQIFLSLKLRPLVIQYMFMSLYVPMKYTRRMSNKNDNFFKINIFVNALLRFFFDAERIISKNLSLPIGTSLISVARKNT